jgi:hypothetical protein
MGHIQPRRHFAGVAGPTSIADLLAERRRGRVEPMHEVAALQRAALGHEPKQVTLNDYALFQLEFNKLDGTVSYVFYSTLFNCHR